MRFFAGFGSTKTVSLRETSIPSLRVNGGKRRPRSGLTPLQALPLHMRMGRGAHVGAHLRVCPGEGQTAAKDAASGLPLQEAGT